MTSEDDARLTEPAELERTAPSSAPREASPDGLQRVVPGETLAERYRLRRFIAAGGMGEVWEADDLLLGEVVALKTLKSDRVSPQALARLKREVTLARRVTHRNVCRTYDFGVHRVDGAPPVFFLTMELLQGTTLSELVASEGPLALPEVLHLVTQLAAGLDAAHRAGVIHRDFKSANVFVEPGPDRRVVIADFGIALALEPGSRLSLEGEGLIGTPAYMAPEQVEGRDPVISTDLYALGIVTFELLTGHLPFEGSSPTTQAMARLTTAPLDPRTFRPQLPERWSQALELVLARRPEDRLQSGEAFVNALRDGSTLASPGLRVRISAGLLSLVVAALTVVGFAMLVEPPRRGWAAIPVDSASSEASANALLAVLVAYSTLNAGDDGARAVVEADPEFAEARLQTLYLAVFANSNRPADANELLHQAQLRRARLTERDRALLDAIEPALLDPPRHDETLSRLTALTVRWPRDAQLWNAIALTHTKAQRTRDAADAFRHEWEADPGSLAGIATEIAAEQERGNEREVERLLSRCLSVNAAHTGCLLRAGDLAAINGDCERLDELGRTLATATPGWKPKSLLYFRYSALLRLGADPATLAELRRVMREQFPDYWQAVIDEAEAVASHDLGRQLALALEATPSDDDIAPTIDAAHTLRLLVELGRAEEGVDLARRAMARAAVTKAPAYLHLDAEPRLWMFLRERGLLEASEHARRRDAWLAAWRARLGSRSETQDALLWVVGWAPFEGGSPALAQEAVDAWGNRPFPRAPLALLSVQHGLPFLADLGSSALQGGRAAEAAQILMQANGVCTWNLREPRVPLLLARAQLELGRRDQACQTLRALLNEWGALKPRSTSVEAARVEATRLGCAP